MTRDADARRAEPNRVPAGRRLRRWSARIVLAAVVGLLAMEVALRVTGVSVAMGRVWRWHPTLGWTQDPSAVFDYQFDGEPVHAEFNRLGFRDIDHALPKPAGTRRIVVLGDSFCEALQVNREQTFQQLLAVAMERRLGGPVEVINLGVGDWGQAQQLLALEQLGFGYDPDLVICQVFPLNDICNNGIELYGLGKSHNDLYRPYFVEPDGPSGPLQQTWRQPLRQWLRQSRVWLTAERIAVGQAWQREGANDAERWRNRAVAAGFPALEPLLYSHVPDPDQPEPVRRAWAVTERLLAAMAARCGERRVGFLGLGIAWEATVGPGWSRFCAAQPPPALDADYPERRLGALFARLGATWVPTRALFEREQATFFPCRDGHLGPGGHRLVADTLAEAIERRGLLK